MKFCAYKTIEPHIIEDLRAFVKENFKLSTKKILKTKDNGDGHPENWWTSETFEELVDDLKKFLLHERNFQTFKSIMEEHMTNKELTNSDVYSRALMERQLFSKIMTHKYYHPKKRNVIAIGMALELSMEEMTNLLLSCGFILSKHLLLDLTIMFCIERKIYNIDDINGLLFATGQEVLVKVRK
jgi:hypothetical protein